MTRFDENKTMYRFQDKDGNILTAVVLVAVRGVYDNEKCEYVNPPTVVSGYGNVRPVWVAESCGIKREDMV